MLPRFPLASCSNPARCAGVQWNDYAPRDADADEDADDNERELPPKRWIQEAVAVLRVPPNASASRFAHSASRAASLLRPCALGPMPSAQLRHTAALGRQDIWTVSRQHPASIELACLYADDAYERLSPDGLSLNGSGGSEGWLEHHVRKMCKALRPEVGLA